MLLEVRLGLEVRLTLLTLVPGEVCSLALVHPGAVLLHPLLAEEVQLTLVTFVEGAQTGLHLLALGLHGILAATSCSRIALYSQNHDVWTVDKGLLFSAIFLI